MLTSRGSASGYPSSGVFTVRGQSVRGLYPGVVRNMTLTLSNPYNFDLQVTTLRGKVSSSSRRKCRPSRSTVSAKTYSGELPLVLRARSKRTVGSIPITMAHASPTTCSSTTFTVLLLGYATKVRG